MTKFKIRPVLVLAVVLLPSLFASCMRATGRETHFNVVEATILEMQRAMEEGRVTSRELVEAHLLRIAIYEERVNATISVNPNALTEAERLDSERVEGHVRGPLHGIPVALKDNVHTIDLPTTGGALAFEDYVPPYRATLTTNLRDAGAIILAKTVMTELANTGITMVCVTHEMGFAGRVADTMMFMDNGQAVETAPPDQFFSEPESERCRRFLKQILHH